MAVVAAEKYPSVTIDTGEHTPIGEDEVLFVLRARDGMAVPAIECYRVLCEAGNSPPDHLAAIDRSIEQMRSWQQTNLESVKQPD